jgi:thiamine-phosphate pyrophosphorylase
MALSYYITDRTHFGDDESQRRSGLLECIARLARAGVSYIQLREKELSPHEIERLAVEALHLIAAANTRTQLLINHRTDIALAVDAAGVHLTSDDLSASEARAIAAKRWGTGFLIGVSCHSAAAVRLAESHGADFAVLGPVYEKTGESTAPVGLDELRRATATGVPPDMRVEAGDVRRRLAVFALGGVTLERAAECVAAGAAGVAGIRLFQQLKTDAEAVALISALRRL